MTNESLAGIRRNLIGQRFGSADVLSFAGKSPRGQAMWNCKCALCGREFTAYGYNLSSGHTTSCGCKKVKHGYSPAGKRTPEYVAWQSMIARCHLPSTGAYKNYGAKGIRVCQEWRSSFVAFLEHVGPCPPNRTSLDRIDPAGHYEPGNVRWASLLEQQRNRRSVKLNMDIAREIRRRWAAGERQCDISRAMSVPPHSVRAIVHNEVWLEDAA